MLDEEAVLVVEREVGVGGGLVGDVALVGEVGEGLGADASAGCGETLCEYTCVKRGK